MTDRPWQSDRVNPVEWLRDRGWEVPWVTFDPGVVKGVTPGTVRRGAQERNDGTAVFVTAAIARVLDPLVGRSVFNLREGGYVEHFPMLPFYAVGWVRVILTFPPGLTLGHVPGPALRQRVTVGYVTEWRPDDGRPGRRPDGQPLWIPP